MRSQEANRFKTEIGISRIVQALEQTQNDTRLEGPRDINSFKRRTIQVTPNEIINNFLQDNR